MKKKIKMRLIRWIIYIVLIIILSFYAPFIYNYAVDYYRNFYACEGIKVEVNKYPICGIDVSSHQDEINWEKVSKSNIRFCFIKATEGTDFVDKRYKKNYIGAKNNNILVGAYHFFRFGSSGKEQAQNFIKNVAIEHLDFPPVVDVERHGNYFSFSKEPQIELELKNYLQEIEKEYKVKPIIYTNIDSYKRYLKTDFEDYEIWICRICSEPEANHWSFWQYSHKGKVKGIEGEVDLNTFNGDKADFLDYIEVYKQSKL